MTKWARTYSADGTETDQRVDLDLVSSWSIGSDISTEPDTYYGTVTPGGRITPNLPSKEEVAAYVERLLLYGSG